MADKRLAIACILCDRATLEAVKAALGVTEWEADAPYCTFTMPYGEGTVQGRFFGNEMCIRDRWGTDGPAFSDSAGFQGGRLGWASCGNLL